MIYAALFGGLLPASIILSAFIVEYRKSLNTKMNKKVEKKTSNLYALKTQK